MPSKTTALDGSVTEKAYNWAPVYVLTDVGTAR